MFLLNLTKFGLFIFKFISLFFDPDTKQKIKVYSSSHPKKLL